jgi:NitT/TauT family transport system ATP-binding protein
LTGISGQKAGRSGEAFIRFDRANTAFGGRELYEQLSFDVRREELACLLGPSGCGKSTALRLLGGLIPLSSGSISIAGEAPEAAWQKMAFVFQSPRLVPWRSALDNVRLGRQLRTGRSTAADRDHALEMLDLVGLSDDAEKYPRMLSGGERQRVAIARALHVDPDIILMDEPFSALDPGTRGRLREEIIRIRDRTRKTILFVTHDVREALFLADRIFVFADKPARIVLETRPDAAHPRDVERDEKLLAQYNELLEVLGAARQGTEEAGT